MKLIDKTTAKAWVGGLMNRDTSLALFWMSLGLLVFSLPALSDTPKRAVPTVLGIRVPSSVSEQPSVRSCKLHASQLVWTPNLAGTLQEETLSQDDFVIRDDIVNAPVEFKDHSPGQIAALRSDQRKQTAQVLRAFREFEKLFQDLFGQDNEKLDSAKFRNDEIRRAKYWVKSNLTGLNKRQRKVMQAALAKWMRLYFKGAIRTMPGNVKRILVKRIETFDSVFASTNNVRFSKIFCFDKSSRRASADNLN